MFTVIFAEKKTISLFEETKVFFGPLYDPNQVAFCEWNKDAENLDTMVPDLHDLISLKGDWRAVVLSTDGAESLNPFDFTGYSDPPPSKKTEPWSFFKARREQRIASFEKAVSNPLVKLTTALTGLPSFQSVLTPEEYASLLSGELQTSAYMLKKQLESLDCPKYAANLEKYRREDLKKFVSDEQIDSLLLSIRDMDVDGITRLIPVAEIFEFIRYIGNDPIYFDPEYAECLIENAKKHELLEQVADGFSLLDRMPVEVICLSPRTFDFETTEQDAKWKKRDELHASRFAEFNLYSKELKFILFDILPEENKLHKFELVKFLSFLLVLASNEIPQGLMETGNVYRVQVEFSAENAAKLCGSYIGKLKSTQILLKEIETQIVRDSDTSVDDRTVRTLFESNINIPVDVAATFDEKTLYAKSGKIGLATDCPTDERTYWSEQYKTINKNFTRYLREPRRTLKTSVLEGVRKNNVIDDERALLLTENQEEDIRFHLADLEQKMVESATTDLFDGKQFTEKFQKEDKLVRREIEQRMTRKKTLFVGLAVALMYFIGFFPLLFGNLNTVKSFLFSLTLTGIVLGLLLVVGFIDLFFLRRRLVLRIRAFNRTMRQVCQQVHSSLTFFSQYLSNTCNLMRVFSVLKKRESAVSKKKKILAYHNMRISNHIQEIYEIFAKYIDFNNVQISECTPYMFDFTKPIDYVYEMPRVHSQRIVYLQQGNEIVIPVDYMESVTMLREELYD